MLAAYPDKNQLSHLNPVKHAEEIQNIKEAEAESGVPGKRHQFLVHTDDGITGVAKSYLTNSPLPGSETADLSNDDRLTKFKKAYPMSINNLQVQGEYAKTGSKLENEILNATSDIK